MGCIVYTDYVYPAFVTLRADISCLLFLFRKCLLLLSLFCFLSLLFDHTSFVFIFGLLANSYQLLACLIRAAIRICLRPDATSSVDMISDLLYQSAGIVFRDGGRVSEGLDMVSLAFHLFVVGTVIFASLLLSQVKNLFIP